MFNILVIIASLVIVFNVLTGVYELFYEKKYQSAGVLIVLLILFTLLVISFV